MKTITCDIAVLGAGPAGLAAAVEASARGADVALFEKGNRIGGVREGGMGPLAVESYIQEQGHVDFSKARAFEFMMAHAHWKSDARLVSEYINMSAGTVEWLADMGVKFAGIATAYYKGAMHTVHNIDHAGEKITTVLWNRAKAQGARLYLEMPVKRLVMENGAVAGLAGTTGDGEAFFVETRAVIVATGGFAGDEALVSAQGYTKDRDIFYTFEVPQMTGDGLKMIWEAGGMRAPMMMDTYIGLPKGYGGPMGTAPLLSGLRQYNLLVNQKGLRFMREDLLMNPAYAGNAVHSQYKGCAVMILDTGLYEEYAESEKRSRLAMPAMPAPRPGEPEREPDPFARFTGSMEDIMREAVQNGVGDFFIADSLEALARQADLPPDTLRKTVSEYNRCCEEKEDAIFHKDSKYLKPIKGPRYYGARFFCDAYGGLGGVKINHRAEVLNAEHDPIPGLYCAGNDANTIFGDTYPFYCAGNTSGFALNTGRMAGISAGEQIQNSGRRSFLR